MEKVMPGQFTVIFWKEYGVENTLKVRNVGNKNESQIQITLDRYKLETEKHLPYITIDIPKHCVKNFIQGVTKEID